MSGTPHIQAKPGDFSELVLMPGDPLRARALAEGHLEQTRPVNAVRNMLAFTGNWRGHEVSIMGSGMGMPSISIYAHELYEHFGVQRIVRVGTCGGLLEEMRLGDLIVASAASTDSAMNRERFNGWDLAPAADMDMLQAVCAGAKAAGTPVRCGEIFSSDWFYHPDPDFVERLQRMGILALDMETAALYTLARQHQRRALTILSVTDVIPTGQRADTAARERAFDGAIDMLLAALLEQPDE